MIDRLPGYSQTPVRNYFETGDFKGQTRSPIPADEATELGKDIVEFSQELGALDNTAADSNPKEGVMDVEMDFLGPTHVEFEGANENAQGFATIGNDALGATLFARNTDEALDLVVVSSDGSFDDGVIHINHANPDESFMTFPDDSMGQFMMAG